MPLGGEEQTSGYKGYGLAGVVELFCGIASGKLTKIRPSSINTIKAGLIAVRYILKIKISE